MTEKKIYFEVEVISKPGRKDSESCEAVEVEAPSAIHIESHVGRWQRLKEFFLNRIFNKNLI